MRPQPEVPRTAETVRDAYRDLRRALIASSLGMWLVAALSAVLLGSGTALWITAGAILQTGMLLVILTSARRNVAEHEADRARLPDLGR